MINLPVIAVFVPNLAIYLLECYVFLIEKIALYSLWNSCMGFLEGCTAAWVVAAASPARGRSQPAAAHSCSDIYAAAPRSIAAANLASAWGQAPAIPAPGRNADPAAEAAAACREIRAAPNNKDRRLLGIYTGRTDPAPDVLRFGRGRAARHRRAAAPNRPT